MGFTLPFSFSTSPQPETQKPAVPARTSSGTRRVLDPITVGQGVLRPFVRGGNGDWANAADIRLVRANVGQVLNTMASSGSTSGELPWRPEFGSVLQLLRFRNLDETTIELARIYAGDALKNWLPRIRVRDVEVQVDFDTSQLVINIKYDILAANRRSVIAPGQTASTAVSVAA